MENHLILEHKVDKVVAAAKRAKAKAAALHHSWVGEGFDGHVHMVVMDTETTGLIKDDQPLPALVELAAQTFDEKFTFSQLVNPMIPIPKDATAIHNITDRMVEVVPPFKIIGMLQTTLTLLL